MKQNTFVLNTRAGDEERWGGGRSGCCKCVSAAPARRLHKFSSLDICSNFPECIPQGLPSNRAQPRAAWRNAARQRTGILAQPRGPESGATLGGACWPDSPSTTDGQAPHGHACALRCVTLGRCGIEPKQSVERVVTAKPCAECERAHQILCKVSFRIDLTPPPPLPSS